MSEDLLMEMVSYRTALDSDLLQITNILNQHIELGDCTLWQGPRTVDDMKDMYGHLSEREGIYVLERESTVIGYGVIVKYHPKEGYRFTCETSVFLDQMETNKGYGKPFKKYILKECQRLGYRHVVAKIFATNQRSISYNKKLGYEIVGVQKDVGFSHGKYIDIVIMQYLID